MRFFIIFHMEGVSPLLFLKVNWILIEFLIKFYKTRKTLLCLFFNLKNEYISVFVLILNLKPVFAIVMKGLGGD